MKKTIGMSLFLLSLIANAAPEIKGNPEDLRAFFHPDVNTLTIRDEAEETAYTDQAIVDIVVKTEDKQLAKAIRLNSELRGLIRKQLVSEGISESHIKNSKFSSSPQYGWFGSKPNSFEVMNRVAVTITSEKHLERIASLVDQHSEITLSGTTFKHSQKDEYEKRVKKSALGKVLDKKTFYEQSLGVKLTPVSFSESEVGFRATQGANRLEEEIVVTGMRAAKQSSYSKQRAVAASGESSFDEVKYRAAITVEFRVE